MTKNIYFGFFLRPEIFFSFFHPFLFGGREYDALLCSHVCGQEKMQVTVALAYLSTMALFFLVENVFFWFFMV